MNLPPDPTAEVDLTGRRLGDYALLRQLGSGGMAVVYLAEQVSLRRPVAFKVLKKSLSGDPTFIRRFQNEAQAAARLVHANIVQIYEVSRVDGIHYMVQEYVPGQNLKQLLTRQGKGLDLPLAMLILRQGAAALAKAAQANITHRDIKPENIMLSRTGEVKIADFGLARMDGEALGLTQVGLTMGTPLYMSPEQVEGKEVDPRSDLYSFGVTCYHMLAGAPPFQGETALAVALQHLNNEPKPLAKIRPDLHAECPELCQIVHRLLAKKPDDRIPSASELVRNLRGLNVEGLEEAAAKLGLEIETVPEVTPALTEATQQLQAVLKPPSKSSGIGQRWWVLLLTVVASLVTAGIGAGYAWLHPPPSLLEFSPDDLPQVTRLDSAQAQWMFATLAPRNVEQNWQAVEKYFPPAESAINLRYSLLAKIGLANYYRRQNESANALKIYDELSRLDERTQAEFRIAGLAGRALVLQQLGQTDEVPEALSLVVPSLSQLRDDTLRSDLEALAQRYQVPTTLSAD